MFVAILTSRRYWKSVFFLAIVFMIAISIIEHMIEYKGLAWERFIEEKISNYQWIRYLISRLAGGLIYGLVMSYFFEMNKRVEK